MAVSVQVVVDRVKDVTAAIRVLASERVMVGIPQSKKARKDADDGVINNALLGYIHEHGAPGANIPARPFLIPGVRNARKEVTALLRKAGLAALDGKKVQVQRYLNMAGLVAVSSVRKKITDGPFVPLAARTLAARRARGVKRTKPLIDTGQLRQSITYVIRHRVK